MAEPARTTETAAPRPFRDLLGDDGLCRLAAPLRVLHDLDRAVATAGLADIEAAPMSGLRGPLAWLFCWAAGMPKPGRGVPVTVVFTPDGRGREHWARRFGERRYESTMRAGAGSEAGLLIEHFGLFDLHFALSLEPPTGAPSSRAGSVESGSCGLRWRTVGWRLFGLPLPRLLLPRVDALESGADGRFCFDIDVAFAWLGPVLRYKGWLEPQ